MPERHGSFDPDAFGRAVEAALIAGIPGRLDALLVRTLNGPAGVVDPQLWLIVAEICLKMKRRKQARRWLAQLLAEATPRDVPHALSIAIQAGQTPLVLGFCRELSPASVSTPEAGVELAQDIARFANRLRLPHGRNGAWRNHLELLETAATLLAHVVPELTSGVLQSQALRDLARIRRMRGISRQLTVWVLSRPPDHVVGTSTS